MLSHTVLVAAAAKGAFVVAQCAVAAEAPTLVHFQYQGNGPTASVAGVLIKEDAATLQIFDLQLLRERSLKKSSIRLLTNPATEQQVAARIGIAPVAAWFVAQAVPFRGRSGQVASVDAPFAQINLGVGDGLANGQTVEVVRGASEVRDPATGAILGSERHTIGQAEVIDAQQKLSRIRPVGNSTINFRVGDSVHPVRQGLPVAVLPLVNDSGAATRGGLQLAEEITSYLSKNIVPIVERTMLDKAVKELKLGGGAQFSDEARIRIGKLLGAYALVVGTIQGSEAQANVNLRLVEVETGKVLYATTLTAKRIDMTPIGQPGSGRTTPLVGLKPFDVVRGPATWINGHEGTKIKMHPPSRSEGQGFARAKYHVNGKYRSLRFTAYLPPHKKPIKDPIEYTILGDERQLWYSGPVKLKPTTLTDEVDIQGVKVLEFRVRSQGDATGAHAGWDDVLLVE